MQTGNGFAVKLGGVTSANPLEAAHALHARYCSADHPTRRKQHYRQGGVPTISRWVDASIRRTAYSATSRQ